MYSEALIMSQQPSLFIQQTIDMHKNRHEEYEGLSYSRAMLQRIKETKLKALLKYATTHSPFYRKWLAGIEIEHITEETLAQIPPINKAILMENWDDIVTNKKLNLQAAEDHIEKMRSDENAIYFQGRYHVLATSKTSGKKGIFIYDWHEWNRYYLHFRRHRLYNQDRSALLLDPYKKMTVAMVVASSPVYAMYSLAKSYYLQNVETFHFPITLPINQITTGLNQLKIDILQGLPSTIYKLCQEAELGKLSIEPKIISVGAEPLYPPIRDLINKTWPHAGIFNTLGSSEGLIGVNCHANSKEMHLNDDAIIIEPVDNLGQRSCLGDLADKFYFTNLYNYTLPLIRYEFAEKIQFLNKDCTCGVKHQLIAEPQGRPQDDFIYKGGIYVHHLSFVTPLLHERTVFEYQVQQTQAGADIKIVPNGKLDTLQLKQTIENNLKQLGVPNPVINIIVAPDLPYPESGKVKRFFPITNNIGFS